MKKEWEDSEIKDLTEEVEDEKERLGSWDSPAMWTSDLEWHWNHPPPKFHAVKHIKHSGKWNIDTDKNGGDITININITR